MTSAILSERGRSHGDDAARASTHLTPAQSGAAIVQPCQPASGSYSPTAGPTRATGIAPRLNTRVSVGAQLATVARAKRRRRRMLAVASALYRDLRDTRTGF